MRRLTLMRHGEARWKDTETDDFARALSRRGISGAEAMAGRLRELGLVPDRLLTSPAHRTGQTAEIVARELALPTRHVLREEGLYLASAADLLRCPLALPPMARANSGQPIVRRAVRQRSWSAPLRH